MVAKQSVDKTNYFLVRNIPQPLRRRFKLLCVKLGVSMNEMFLRLMADEIRKGKLPEDEPAEETVRA